MQKYKKLIVFLLAAAALAGCKPKPILVKGELVEVTPAAVVVRVTSEPGVKVELSNHVREGGGTLVPPSGTVDLSLPRASFRGYYGSKIDVAAGKPGFRKDRWGTSEVTLPVPIESLLWLPEAPLGAAILRGKRELGGKPLPIALARARQVGGKEPPVVYWGPSDATLPLVVGGPKGATLTIGSASVVVPKTGLADLDVPSAEIARNLAMDSLAPTKGLVTSLPLVVEKDGARAASEEVLRVGSPGLRDRAWIAEAVDRMVRAPEASSAPVEAVLWRQTDGEVVHLGAPGKLKDARFVALETATYRDGPKCAYTSFSYKIRYEDVTLRVHDAQTGKELRSAVLPSPRAECLLVATRADKGVQTYRAPEAKFRDLLTSGLAKGFR